MFVFDVGVHVSAAPQVCDELCRTQVNQLEAGILLFTIFIALMTAVVCMGCLDTPTRFETPKEL
jgi:hypothetical protein